MPRTACGLRHRVHKRKAHADAYHAFGTPLRVRLQTYEGIDTCGDRLVEEVEALVAQNPTLRYISLLGHSMGGLLVRYAAGHLYEPRTGLMAGLRPVHFISMATPHLGCDAFGESQARTQPGPVQTALLRRGALLCADCCAMRMCLLCEILGGALRHDAGGGGDAALRFEFRARRRVIQIVLLVAGAVH